MKKRLIYRLFPNINRSISREELTDITLKDIEKSKAKVAELREGLLKAYSEDHEYDIPYFEGILESHQISLNAYKSNLQALENPEVEGRFSYERIRRRNIKTNRAKQPLDLVVEQAKRAHLKRKEEAKQWLENHFCSAQITQRLMDGEYYKDCPIGNFATVEENYYKAKANQCH